MKKITLLLILIVPFLGFSQSFTDSTVHDLQNGNGTTAATCGTADELVLPLTVSGIGTLGTTLYLQSVTFNATHTWNADIQVSLQDPSGATTVLLIQNIGNQGDGFVDCVLDDASATPLPTTTTVVTGTFMPLNPLAAFNGLSADGDWNLIVCDDAGGDVGTVDSWTLTFAPVPTEALDWNNLQWPASGTIALGDAFNVYAQAYEAGLTDVTSGQAPGIEAWIGYSAADTDPSGTGWTWVAASFNVEAGNNDEYTLDLGASIPSPGTYYYASRFRLNGGLFTYGGTGGIWSNDSGVLTVGPPAGDSCANAVDLDAETSPLTASTAGASHDYEVDCLTSTTAKDMVYSVTVPDGYRLVIGQTTNDYDSKHRLAYGASCPGDMLIACTDDPDTETLTWDNTTGSSQTAYWIQSAYTTGSGNFTLAWSVSPIPTCEMPTGLAATPAETTAAISWTASASGGAVGYNWAVMASGEDPDVDTPVDSGSIVGTSDTAANLVAETDYDLYVQTDCDVDGSSPWAGPYSFTSLATPPVNDLACNAVALTVGSGPSSGGAYSNEGATLETSEVGGSCWFFGNAASNSVWFTFMAPASGEVLISTAFGDGTLEDTQIKVYTITDCGDLSTATEVGCDEDDDSGVGPGTPDVAAVLQMSGLVSGNTYYIQVDGYGSGVGTFDIEISDPTLSVDDNEFVGFKYYPNPVNNILTLKAQKNIESVAVYNMLGQQVMRTAPNAVTNELDMSSLSTGSYFVEVSVEGVSQTVRIVKQ